MYRGCDDVLSECFGTCCIRAAVCPLTCQFAVELLQEAGLSGVEGQKNKADWVGTRLMSGLCLCGGGRIQKKRGQSCMKGGCGCMHLQIALAQKHHAGERRCTQHAVALTCTRLAVSQTLTRRYRWKRCAALTDGRAAWLLL